jgi:hypothetical protein
VAPASLGAGVTLASVVNFASAAAFNLLTIVDFGGAGEVEQLQTGASSYTVLVPPGKALRYAYGALGKVPGYFNEGAISVSKDINLALLDDTLISTTTDLTSAQSLLAWDTLNTSTNKLVMRMGAGSLDPVSAQAGISWLSWQHQSLRLIARTGISTHITTTASGSKFGTTAITIGGKSTNGALDISEILAFVEAPSGHIINPKSTGAAGEPPTGFQVTVTKVRPTIAKVEDSQLAAISALTTANIEASAVIAKAAALVSLQTDVTAVKAKTDNLPAAPAAVGSAMTLTSDYDAAKSAASQASVNAIPTNPVLTSDSRLSNLDAAVSTRLASSAYTAPDNAGVAAVKAKTDALPAEPAAVGSAMTLTAAYDAAKTAATQTSVTALGAPAQATALASLVTVNQAEHDATQAAIAVLPVPPAAASVATAVRTELAAELGRVDAAVSTRLATAGYTAPPAASAIRAELEVTGGKLDKAMKAAQSAEENTV